MASKRTEKATSEPSQRRLWPADNVERRRVDSLVPYARNSRTHDDAQISKIAASMREWGVTTPLLVDEEGTIIAGHARVLAAERLGLAQLPVMVARGWTEAQKRAYVIADNRLAEDAGWDRDLLQVELQGLTVEGFDLSLTGFSDEELGGLLAQPTPTGLTDPDETPEPPADPVTVLGDVWLLGAYYECEKCGKHFTLEQGRAMGGECNCDKAAA